MRRADATVEARTESHVSAHMRNAPAAAAAEAGRPHVGVMGAGRSHVEIEGFRSRPWTRIALHDKAEVSGFPMNRRINRSLVEQPPAALAVRVGAHQDVPLECSASMGVVAPRPDAALCFV